MPHDSLIKLSHCAYYWVSDLLEADSLLRFLGICTAAFLPTGREMTDEYPTLYSEWQVKCREAAGPGHLLGQRWKGGRVFLWGHPLCTRASIRVKPKLAPRVTQDRSEHIHGPPAAPVDRQPLRTGAPLSPGSRKRLSPF